MNNTLKSQFRRSIVLAIMVMMAHLAMAQQRSISGTVKDDSDLPLPGANVVSKETRTSTNEQGSYEIKVRKGSVIEFSFIGYVTQWVKVKNQKTINVKLQPDLRPVKPTSTSLCQCSCPM